MGWVRFVAAHNVSCVCVCCAGAVFGHGSYLFLPGTAALAAPGAAPLRPFSACLPTAPRGIYRLLPSLQRACLCGKAAERCRQARSARVCALLLYAAFTLYCADLLRFVTSIVVEPPGADAFLYIAPRLLRAAL